MNGESCIRKAYDYILNNDFEQAIYWFEQAIAADPDNAAYYHKCAVSCARSGKWSKARVYADIAEKLDPANEEYRYHSKVIQAQLMLAEARGLLAVMPPRLQEAADLLHRAANLDPLSFDIWYTLGMVYATIGNFDEALEHVREAVRLNPEHSAGKRLFADIKRKRRMHLLRTTIRK